MDAIALDERRTPTCTQLRGKDSTCDEKHDNASSNTQLSASSKSTVRFACPFLKANPRKMQAKSTCARSAWPTIARLKEHLYRCHGQQKLSCPRCVTPFEKEKELDEHLRAERLCKISNSSDRPSQTISPAQMYMLKRRKGQYREKEEEKWFEIFSILFPDKKRPSSPYAKSRDGLWGSDLHVIDDLQESMTDRVATSAIRFLRKESLLQQGARADQRVRRIIATCVSAAFQQYKNQYDDRQPPSGDNQEPKESPPDTLDVLEQLPSSTVSTTSRAGTPSTFTISSQSTALTDFGDDCETLLEAQDSIPMIPPAEMNLVPSAYTTAALTEFHEETAKLSAQLERQELLAPFALPISSEHTDSHILPVNESLDMDWFNIVPTDVWEHWDVSNNSRQEDS